MSTTLVTVTTTSGAVYAFDFLAGTVRRTTGSDGNTLDDVLAEPQAYVFPPRLEVGTSLSFIFVVGDFAYRVRSTPVVSIVEGV